MAITALPTAPSRTNPTQFSAQTDAFLAALSQFVNETNSTVANLNSIAVGGAYAIPYIVSVSSSTIGIGGYFTIQSSSTALYFDSKDSTGADVSAVLLNLMSGTSTIKATLRLVEVGDPSRYSIWNITSYTNNVTSGYATAQLVADYNGARAGKQYIALLQRAGEKGDTGLTQSMLLRDQKAVGTQAQSLAASAWTTRVLNTVIANTISSSSLSNNAFTIPAGTYWIDAHASIYGGGVNHQIRLFNVSDNSVLDVGSSDYGSTGGNVVSHSFLRTILTITAAKSYRVEHWCSASVAGGNPVSATGSAEVYTEVKITKVA